MMPMNFDDIALYEFEFCLDLFSLFIAKTFKVYSAESGDFCGLINASKTNEKLPDVQALKRPAPAKATKNPSPAKAPRKPASSASVPIPAQQKPSSTAGPPNQVQHFKEFISDREKLYLCDLCSYKSNDKSNMKKHVNAKHNENCPKFQCSMCPLQVKARPQLKNHYMKVHSLPESLAKSATNDSAHVWDDVEQIAQFVNKKLMMAKF